MLLVRVGRVLKPHGVRGYVKCAYTTDHPERLASRNSYLLVDPRSSETLELEVAELQLKPDYYLIKFVGFDAPEPLKKFNGWDMGYNARRGELPRDNPDEVYMFELPGLEVRLPDGSVVGRVKDIIETAAHVLLELDAPGGRLIPFTREAVPEVNLAEGWLLCTYDFTSSE